MNGCSSSLVRVIAACACLWASTQAQALSCTTVGASGSVGFTIAVASNFNAPTLSLATAYADSQGYKITVCQDSSGNLYNAIIPSNGPQYALFFSADTTRPAQISTNYPTLVAASPANYAKGIPVFLLSPSAYAAASGNYRAVSYLTTGLSAGANAQRSDSTLPAVTNHVKVRRAPSSPPVSYLAIGNPSLAPYGVAAGWVLGSDSVAYPDNMGLWASGANVANAGTNVTASCAGFVTGSQWICEYDNIDYTLQAITNNQVTAGFVAYAQVCPTWAGNAYQLDQYVLFPGYNTMQAYVQLNVSDATTQARATAFLAYLGIGTGSWNSWLTSHCYQSL